MQISSPNYSEKSSLPNRIQHFTHLKYLNRKTVALFKKTNPTYHKLEYIEHNDSKNILAGHELKKVFKVIKSQRFLTHLNLQFMKCAHVNNQILSTLGHCLRNLPFLRTLTLDFSQCEHLTDIGLDYLRKSFQKLTYLENISLNFTDCTEITNKGLKSLSQGIKGLVSLKRISVDFSDCVIIEDQGLYYMSEGFKRLKLLQLKFTSQRLTMLSGDVFNGFCRNLQKMKMLRCTRMDFSGCSSLTSDSFSELSRGLSGLPVLQNLDMNLSWTEVCDQVLANIIKHLKLSKSLKTFYIDCMASGVSDQGLKMFGEALKEFPALQKVAVGFIWCPLVTKEALAELDEQVETINSVNQKKVMGGSM